MENTTTALTPPPAPGIGHFIAQSDAVGHTLLVLLVLMSIASWAIIVAKGVAQALRARRSRAFLDQFWNASTLDEVRAELQDRKSTRLNSSHLKLSRMPSSA